MNTGGEAAEQIVRMSLEGFEVAAKITGAGAKNIAILLYSILKEEKKTKGKASKYGKTKCATAKVLASLLSAVFITTLVVIFNLLIAVAIYGTEGLDCSILFAPIDFLEGYIPFNITCGTVLKYQILLAFMSAISVTGIVLILSAVCKSQMIAFVISAAIHVIPIMLPISEH